MEATLQLQRNDQKNWEQTKRYQIRNYKSMIMATKKEQLEMESREGNFKKEIKGLKNTISTHDNTNDY